MGATNTDATANASLTSFNSPLRALSIISSSPSTPLTPDASISFNSSWESTSSCNKEMSSVKSSWYNLPSAIYFLKSKSFILLFLVLNLLSLL